MIKISEICVGITGYLLHHISIHPFSKNIKHSMLAHPNFNNISIENYKREQFPTFVLSDGEYITRSLNLLKVELIANIQCYLSIRKTQLHKKINAEEYCQHIC